MSGTTTTAQRRSPWESSWQRLLRNRPATTALAILILMLVACFIGPLFMQTGYEEQDLDLGAIPPSWEHPFGTDIHGRDLFTRTLHGGRISFLVGIAATTVALVIGVSYGIISGYAGGTTDRIMMRIVDAMYSFPFIIFVILLMALFGRNIILIFAAIGAIEWLNMARIIRGQTLSLKHRSFVHAAQCLGQPTRIIMTRHLLPNLAGIIIIYATLTIPTVMLLEAFVSFLGLGVQAPQTSWGDLIREGADAMETQWWRLVFPSIAFSVTLFSLNFLGDGLRDAFDPRGEK